nr:hyp [Cotesia vestalis bracovirus]
MEQINISIAVPHNVITLSLYDYHVFMNWYFYINTMKTQIM